MQAIDQLGRDLTVLIIAHRVTTLRNCDTIYRLHRGTVIQQGGYDEVIGAASPEIIALSIAAEVQAALANRDGGAMRDAS